MVAGAVLVALAGGVALASRPEGVRSPPSTTITTTTSSSSTTVSTTTTPREIPSSTLASTSEPIAVVNAGLEAWGEFAVTGDLEVLEPWFDPDGPQFAQFRTEASTLSSVPPGDPPYSVTFEEIGQETVEGEIRLHGRVVFVRTGEPSQSFDWVIVLREGETWQIWTIEEHR